MNKFILFLIALVFFGCEDQTKIESDNTLVFISNEGNFGSSNGSISVFKNDKKIQEISDIGDVAQSMLIDKDKLFVIVNNSHLIKVFQISDDGLKLPGVSIPTENSSPREMVVKNNKLYFTNHNSQDIKILNLSTYYIEDSIKLDGLPESIVSSGNYLWVAMNMNSDWSSASSVVKVNIDSKKIENIYEVGKGPQQLLIDGDNLWVSRTYYSDDFTQAFFGTSIIDMINNDVNIFDYGKGTVCGGDIFKNNDRIFRTYNGGVAMLNNDLSIQPLGKIGSYNANNLYSASGSPDKVFLGLTSDYVGPDTVYVHNYSGELITEYIVGALPGDYEVYQIK